MVFILSYQLIQTIPLPLNVSLSSYTLIILIKYLDLNFILLPFFIFKASSPHASPTNCQANTSNKDHRISFTSTKQFIGFFQSFCQSVAFWTQHILTIFWGGRDTNEILNYLNIEASRNMYLHLNQNWLVHSPSYTQKSRI